MRGDISCQPAAPPGNDLPAAAARELDLAASAYPNDTAAEHHLRQARDLAPDHAEMLLGFYRYYLYKGMLDDALTMARLCLLRTAHDFALDPQWRRVQRDDADFTGSGAAPHIFLVALRAYAYLHIRGGSLAEAHDAAHKALALDPSDKAGASVLIELLARVTPAVGAEEPARPGAPPLDPAKGRGPLNPT